MVITVIQTLALLTLLSDIFIIILLLTFIAYKFKIVKFYLQIKKIVSTYAYQLAILVSMTATLGSLFFSEVARFNPCLLCWYQRIFMYPQLILLYLAYLKNQQKFISFYIISLSVIGASIALYQYTLQVFPQLQPVKCNINDSASCFRSYTFYFGYITIPMMSLTAFALNIILMSIFSKNKKP